MKILWNQKDVDNYLSGECKKPQKCVRMGMDTHPAMLRSDAEVEKELRELHEMTERLSWIFAGIQLGLLLVVLWWI